MPIAVMGKTDYLRENQHSLLPTKTVKTKRRTLKQHPSSPLLESELNALSPDSSILSKWCRMARVDMINMDSFSRLILPPHTSSAPLNCSCCQEKICSDVGSLQAAALQEYSCVLMCILHEHELPYGAPIFHLFPLSLTLVFPLLLLPHFCLLLSLYTL